MAKVNRNMNKARNSRKHSKRLYTSVAAVAVCAVVAIILVVHFADKNSTPTTENQYTKGQSASQPASSGSQTGGSTNKGSQSTTTTTLIAPTGDFVSDHHPNLSGSPAPNTMTSVCNTSPGATCQIVFTNGSTQKSLSSQVANSGGSAYWTWTLQSIGLTAGSWQVKAVATTGSQTKSASDSMSLVVSQ